MKRKVLFLILAIFAFIPFINVNAEDESRVQIILTNGKGTYTWHTEGFGDDTPQNKSTIRMYGIGESLTLEAEPAEGYGFAGWFVAQEVESETPGVMEWVPGANLTGMASYTFEITEPYYNIMPLFEKQISCSGAFGHNNIWTTGGGNVAVSYPKMELNGTNYTGGEVVDYCVGDEITVYAQTDPGKRFVGWYVSNVEQGPDYYYNDKLVSTEPEYTYKPGVTTVEGIDEPINYLTAVFEEDANKKTFTLDDEHGNQIVFNDLEYKILVFNSTELLGLTDEELEEIAAIEETTVDVIKGMLDDIVSKVKKAVEGKGKLLKIYDFSISDGSPELVRTVDGGFKIRIKITDDMKDYNSFTLYYVDDEYKLTETIKLTKNGDYLEGQLAHLSGYVLMGEKVNTNPNTGDNIVFYISLLGLSLIGLTTVAIYTKKRKFN